MNAHTVLKIATRGTKVVRRYLRNQFDSTRYTPAPIPRLHIETTNICNSNCVYCANSAMTRKRTTLPMELFRKAVDEYAHVEGEGLDFSATIGDPLLDKHLLTRARYVMHTKQFKSLGFVTTLQWLHRLDIDEFFDSGITWLAVSTALSGAETYKRFFGVDMYDQFLVNLKTLIEKNRKRGEPMDIRIAIKPVDLALDRVIRHPDFQMIDQMVGQDLVTAANERLAVDDWGGIVELPSYLMKRPLYPRWRHPCGFLYHSMIVFSNGNIGICGCRDLNANSDLVFGNIEYDSLMSVWNGPEVRSIRRAWRHSAKAPRICRDCRHFVY